MSAGLLFTATLLPGFGRGGDSVRDEYAALPAALAAAGVPITPGGAPIITRFPIWLAESTGARTLALPNESPDAVLLLARAFPGTSLLIVGAGDDGIWPEVAATDATGRRCFQPVPLAPSGLASLDDLRVFRIVCP